MAKPKENKPHENKPAQRQESRIKAFWRRRRARAAGRKRRLRLEDFRLSYLTQIFKMDFVLNILVLRWKALVLTALCAAVLASSMYLLDAQYTARAVLSWNYEESSKGKNPNGTRFNISDLRSLDVAEKSIKAAGLEGVVEPQELVDALSISPFSNRNYASEADYYINSSYNLTFKKPAFGMGEISAEDMLDLILNCYKEKFYGEHIITAKILEDMEMSYDQWDYSEISLYLSLMTSRIDRYLDMRINEAGSFVSESGDTFKACRKLVENLVSYDLANYDSYIWENGIAKDKQQQIDRLVFINHRLDRSYAQNMKENQARLSIIDEYNKAMTSSILIPTYDQEDEFYMSRTKTGIDDLAKAAEQRLNAAKQLQLDAVYNWDRAEKMWQDTTDAQRQHADKLAEEIRGKMEEIVERIVVLDNTYTLEKTRNYITFEKKKPSLIDRIHYKRVAMITLLALLAAYCFCALQKKMKGGQTAGLREETAAAPEREEVR